MKQDIMSKNNSNETGRSLVEMLGVLAIIGVLSVGGIAGYTTAMNKHRANTLLDEASKRAIVVATQVSAGKTASDSLVSDFKTEVDGHTITVAAVENKPQFTISFTSVSQAVCEKMQDAVSGNATIQAFSPETCSATNSVVLTYNNDMSNGSSTADAGPEACTCEDAAYPCVKINDECISKFYVGNTFGFHNDLETMTDTELCGENGRWASISDLACNPGEFCVWYPEIDAVVGYLRECTPNGTTIDKDCKDGSLKAFFISLEGEFDYVSRYDDTGEGYDVLCVRK